MFRGNQFSRIVFEQLEARILRSTTMAPVASHEALTSAIDGTLDHAALGETVVHAGDFDQTFGAGGKTVIDVFGPDSAQTVVIQSDGKILVAGQSGLRGQADPPMSTDISVVRLNSDGSLDTAFGASGIVLLHSNGWSGHAAAVPMAVMDDGRIVVGGSGLHRLNSDGSLDTSFGDGGSVSATGYFGVMVVMGDGKIIPCNMITRTPSLVRFNSDGSADTTFGSNGSISMAMDGTDWVQVPDMVLQLDGRLVVLGSARLTGASSNTMFASRFDANGTIDTSFGTGGTSLIILPPHMSMDGGKLHLLNNGKILVAGAGRLFDDTHNEDGTMLLRLKRNGALDKSFGQAGVMLDNKSIDNNPYAIAVQEDGRILVAGNGDSAITLMRYNEDGSRDLSFGNKGRFVTRTQSNSQWCEAATGVALQADGRIVLIGQIELQAFSANSEPGVFDSCDFFVMRLTGTSGPLVVTDNGALDDDDDQIAPPMPQPEPQPQPEPAPTPEPEPMPDPIPAPHADEDHERDEQPVLTGAIGLSHSAVGFTAFAQTATIGLDLLGSHTDDALFSFVE
jgi:uncharacterized delta-60 repeat protein